MFSVCQRLRQPRNWRPAIYASQVLAILRHVLGSQVVADASQSQPASRLGTGERCTDLFMVQVRGGLNDCAVTNLQLHMMEDEISIEWKELFTEFFGEKDIVDKILKEAPVILRSPFRRILIIKLIEFRRRVIWSPMTA